MQRGRCKGFTIKIVINITRRSRECIWTRLVGEPQTYKEEGLFLWWRSVLFVLHSDEVWVNVIKTENKLLEDWDFVLFSVLSPARGHSIRHVEVKEWMSKHGSAAWAFVSHSSHHLHTCDFVGYPVSIGSQHGTHIWPLEFSLWSWMNLFPLWVLVSSLAGGSETVNIDD